MRSLVLVAFLAAALAGCSGSEVAVSKTDEEKYKNPAPFDASKLPANAFDRPGPRFVGQPTGASNPSGAAPQISPSGGR